MNGYETGGQQLQDAIYNGINSGYDIASEYFDFDVKKMERVFELTSEAFHELTDTSSDRFRFLFSQMVAIAEASRIANNEPLLDFEQIKDYLDESVAFFNSWRHL